MLCRDDIRVAAQIVLGIYTLKHLEKYAPKFRQDLSRRGNIWGKYQKALRDHTSTLIEVADTFAMFVGVNASMFFPIGEVKTIARQRSTFNQFQIAYFLVDVGEANVQKSAEQLAISFLEYLEENYILGN